MLALEHQPKVSIVLLNWNGWMDTIECLESLYRLDYKNFQVIICDNNSQDKSIYYMKMWAEGKLNCYRNFDDSNLPPILPPIDKPLPYREISKEDFLKKDDYENLGSTLIILDTGSNLGFAGGCNLGIEFSIVQGSNLIWFLNNDTVVAPNALKILVDQLERHPKIGFVSSEIYSYERPNVKSGTGGKIVPLDPRFTMLHTNDESKELYQCDHIAGCAMLVRSEVIETVGYMDEDYFLYREETDWMIRASRLKWEIAVAAKSKIWHKGAASSGYKSSLNEYYNTRNTLKVIRRFYPFQYIWIVSIYIFYRLAAFIFGRDSPRKYERFIACLKGFNDHLHSNYGKANI
jgi:GT2 family glycosyltransferase